MHIPTGKENDNPGINNNSNNVDKGRSSGLVVKSVGFAVGLS